MSEQDKAREKAREKGRLLLEWAEGKTLQQEYLTGKWIDYASAESPVIHDPSRWRVKPEPRKAWSAGVFLTEDQEYASKWREFGHTVTEWQEVVS